MRRRAVVVVSALAVVLAVPTTAQAARGFSYGVSAAEVKEQLGGVYVRSQPITIGSAILEEVSYGWPRLDAVRY